MTDTQVADALIGTLVDGRYRVRDRVARGGMATVYVATDERLERTVALKMIHPAQATEPRFVERFIDEAKAIARLTHPNVVAAYDQGTHQNLPYLVMEYVPGRTLREILRSRRRLTPTEALAITEQVLAALAAAHRAGLVHRDVKPENVLVAEAPSGGVTNLIDGVVKVTDFGLAQAVAASTMAGGSGDPLLATVAYVSPELVKDGRADPRSDVYSAGIVLFEMLTGRVPFDAGAPAEVAWRHVEQDVPRASAYVSGLPSAVDELVARATARDPGARPSDAGVLLSEVQAVREKIAVTNRAGAAETSALPLSARRTVASPPPSDATVVMSRLDGSSGPGGATSAPDRPAWARLPSSRNRPPKRAVPGARRAARMTAPTEDADQDGKPPWLRTPHRRTVFAAVGGALVLLLVVGGWWFGLGRWMPAPELVGLSETEAVAEAERNGLSVRFGEPEYSETVPVDHVLTQEPSGRMLRGGTVVLTLSLGPEQHPVPDLIGADVEVAIRQLESLGLVVQEGEPAYSNTVPEGRVLELDPPVGEVLVPGEQVTVTASQGRPPIEVPFVIGKQVGEATQQMEALGLTVSTEEVDSDKPKGEVVGQDPDGNTGAVPGQNVRLEISKGPPTQPVPNVVGQRCKPAIEAIEDAGFAVELGFDDRGRVLLQNPSAGTGLPPGSEVTIWCS